MFCSGSLLWWYFGLLQRLEESERRAQHTKEQLQRERRHLRRRLEQLGVERTRMDSTGSTRSSSDKSDSDQGESRRPNGISRLSNLDFPINWTVIVGVAIVPTHWVSSPGFAYSCSIHSFFSVVFSSYIVVFCLFLTVLPAAPPTEDLDVDVEGTDYLLGDLEWSTSSVSDSGDERGSLRSSCSDEGYSSASLQRLQDTQERAKQLACSL